MGRPLAIVHRDVSPQNILVGADGVARLIDFGVAKATVRLQTTRDGTLKGKLAYMAPEQVSGGATRLTDIWAAAVVLWECLTGARLFYEECESKVFTRVLSQRITPPSEIVRSLPRELDGILLSALSRVPSARFPTAEHMAAAIERVVHLAPPAAVAQWVSDVAGDLLAGRDRLVSSIERAGEPPRREEAERISAIVVKASRLAVRRLRASAPSSSRMRSRARSRSSRSRCRRTRSDALRGCRRPITDDRTRPYRRPRARHVTPLRSSSRSSRPSRRSSAASRSSPRW
jgi:serine/threonine protein kinase